MAAPAAPMNTSVSSASTNASASEVESRSLSRRRRHRASCLRRCCAGVCIASAIACVVLGAAVALGFDRVFSDHLKAVMPLANGSMSYQGWEKVPTEILFQVWLFNVTNPSAVVKAGAAPALEQLGPFTFVETRQKRDIEFHENGTVSYREFLRYRFRPDLSVGDLRDFQVTSVNMPYLVTSFQMRFESIFLRKMVDSYLREYSGGLFVTRSAGEILLGYRDPGLAKIESLVKMLSPNQRFQSTTGLFAGQNDTDKGCMLVNTGRQNLSLFNQVERWKGVDRLSLWSQDWANRVAGTDGSMFPPPVRPADRLTLFVPDICRPIDIVYNSSGTVEGIPVLRFRPPPELLMNATLWPPNQAFCQPDCLDSGVLNVTTCQHNVPIVVSSPHFFGAPAYQTAVTGLDPTPDLETVVNVEPNTGFVLSAQRKMQSSVIVQRVPGFEQTERLNTSLLLMPLMWLNESAKIEPGKAALFRLHLLTPIRAATWGQWVLIGVGLLWTAAAALTCSLTARRRRQRLRRGAELDRAREESEATGTIPKQTATATTTLRLMDDDEGPEASKTIGVKCANGCSPSACIGCHLNTEA
ncbi:hypothetical protein BOX15_Mlig025211g3 [Macrostomum lignano]|uniref:Lysosome membrane protein 2 n=1 Tax=Macrostomum lignano TaxID=282301 RepID=A0A267DHT7_9PLAT|nr:hypothetical protein BOX15_Mlig025211g1 [Macrostomum lignano]PAA92367.1 hypothetical protein BOX15_Mlig025211g3 [Macrostomum lignano]